MIRKLQLLEMPQTPTCVQGHTSTERWPAASPHCIAASFRNTTVPHTVSGSTIRLWLMSRGAVSSGGAVSVFVREPPPPVEVGRRPLGGGIGGGVQGGVMGGGGPEGRLRGGGVQVGHFGVVGGGGHRLPLPPLALPLG